jgi:hypothetical protein
LLPLWYQSETSLKPWFNWFHLGWTLVSAWFHLGFTLVGD